jgi:hypothetical protein
VSEEPGPPPPPPPAPDRSLAYAIAASAVLIIAAIGGGVALSRAARPDRTPVPTASPRPFVRVSPTPTPDTGPLVFTQPLSAGCAAGDSVYVVADGGGVGRFSFDRWQLIDVIARTLVAAACQGDRLVAVGPGGQVVTIDDHEQTLRSDTVQPQDLSGVAQLADGVLVVGQNGSVQRQGPNGWGVYANGIDEDLFAIAAFGPTSAWAVGAGGVSYRLEPAGWRPVATGVAATLRAISATSVTDAVAVGDDGVVLFWDGGWKPLADVPKVGYHAVLRAGPVTYAAGDGGVLVRFSSTSLARALITPISLGTTCTLRGLFARGDEVWVVGSDGGRAAVWRITQGTAFRWGECP